MASLKITALTVCRYSCQDETKCFAVDNPATGKTLTRVQAGDTNTAAEAVAVSQHAFEHVWKSTSPRQRGDYLLKCAEKLDLHLDELAELLCLENGKPLRDAREFDLVSLVGSFRFFGSLVDKLPSEFYDRDETYCTIFHEPYGVCCAILPFNWPPIHTGAKVAPALAAGNTIILKPGEQAPLTVLKIIEILETVLPVGVVQAVPGLGAEVPQALVSHPLVRMISFTGSTSGGAAVASIAGEHIKPIQLELGGKNAFIIFSDANLDFAIRDAVEGAFFNKGEACTATSRLLVQRSVYDEVAERLSSAIKQLRVGDGQDPRTHVGPLVSRTHQQRVLDYIALGENEGARLAAKSSLPMAKAYTEGFFCPATFFTDVTPDMRIFKEEIFGPVVTLTVFDTFDDAIRLTNLSDFGLTSAIYTSNTQQANRAVRAIDAGAVYVNNYRRKALGAPHGGVKHSGYGREHWIGTLREWSQPKAVHTPSTKTATSSWRAIAEIFDTRAA